MSLERKEAVNNNGYPTTVYGTTSAGEAAHLGAFIGNPSMGSKSIEFVFDASDVVSASDYGNTMIAKLPAGYVLGGGTVNASETFAGGTALQIGFAKAVDGSGADADGIYTGTPAVGTLETVAPAGALLETLTEDYFVTVSTDHTAGKCTVVLGIDKVTA